MKKKSLNIINFRIINLIGFETYKYIFFDFICQAKFILIIHKLLFNTLGMCCCTLCSLTP